MGNLGHPLEKSLYLEHVQDDLNMFCILFLNDKQCRSRSVGFFRSWFLQKLTDLDLHCFQIRTYLGSAGQGLKGLVTCGSFFSPQ